MGLFGKKKEQPARLPELSPVEVRADILNELAGMHGDDGWDYGIWLDNRLVGMAADPLAFWHDDTTDVEYDIVGESNYMPWLRMIQSIAEPGEREVRASAILVRDILNEYDPNAVAVTMTGRLVGYIPRADAPRIAGLLDQLAEVDVDGILVPACVGWDEGERRDIIGVRLDLPPGGALHDGVLEVRPFA